MTSTEGRLTIEGRETWYRVTGDLSTGVPLVLLHGGPGAAHNYLDSLTRLASEDRAVVHYDQVGCGLSTHLPEAPKSSGLFSSFSTNSPPSSRIWASPTTTTCSDKVGAACSAQNTPSLGRRDSAN